MNQHDMAEQAYKKGYEAGKRDAVRRGHWVRQETGLVACCYCNSVIGLCRSEDAFEELGRENVYCFHCGAYMGDNDGKT